MVNNCWPFFASMTPHTTNGPPIRDAALLSHLNSCSFFGLPPFPGAFVALAPPICRWVQRHFSAPPPDSIRVRRHEATRVHVYDVAQAERRTRDTFHAGVGASVRACVRASPACVVRFPGLMRPPGGRGWRQEHTEARRDRCI